MAVMRNVPFSLFFSGSSGPCFCLVHAWSQIQAGHAAKPAELRRKHLRQCTYGHRIDEDNRRSTTPLSTERLLRHAETNDPHIGLLARTTYRAIKLGRGVLFMRALLWSSLPRNAVPRSPQDRKRYLQVPQVCS